MAQSLNLKIIKKDSYEFNLSMFTNHNMASLSKYYMIKHMKINWLTEYSITQLTTKIKEIKKCKREIVTCRLEIIAYSDEKTAYIKEIVAYSDEIAACKTEIQMCRWEIKSYTREIQMCRTEIYIYKAEIDKRNKFINSNNK